MATKKTVKIIKKETFKLNDKEYKAKNFGINTICDMQDIGFDPTENANNILQFVRAYVAVCSGTYDLEFAGNEMDEHIQKYGNFDELREILFQKVEESGFFRPNTQTAEETTPTGETTESEEKAE